MGDRVKKKNRLEPIDFTFGPQPTRREFLAYMGALLVASGCGGSYREVSTGEAPPPAPQLASDPFTLGIASGDPLPDRVILWTRLTLDPIRVDTLPDVDIPITWEVARDADFQQIVTSGWEYATPQLAHSVHIDVTGLASDTWYFYRMRVGDQWESPIGRTRTLPAPTSSPERFRVALASCQKYRDGYYNAHVHLAEEDIDLLFFVGDYIYESGIGEDSIRQHEADSPVTLDQYRNRYGHYKSDPDLRLPHTRFPWVTTWDDHEVVNDYAGLHIGGASEEEALQRRRAAYQAYYEHLPLRVPLPSDFAHLGIYRSFEFGDLASVSVLDTRQYRDAQPCGDRIGRVCAEAEEPGRTILGAEQKAWLKNRLQQSRAVWNVVAQQVVFGPLRFGRVLLNPDQWDGYAVERQEMLDLFAQLGNVVVLTGDIHAAAFASLPKNAKDLASGTVAYEVVCTSISSGGEFNLDAVRDLLLPENPHIHHLNASNRGYAIIDFRRDKVTVEYRIVDTVAVRGAALSTDARFRIDRATLGLERL